MKCRRGKWAVAIGAMALLLGLVAPAPSQQLHRNGFETAQSLWVKGGSDTTFTEVAHASSDQGAHDGQRSEYIQISAKEGSFVYYQYALGKAPVTEELAGGLWVKSNRAGIQLAARIILPNEREPNNIDYHLTTTIRGEIYRNVGRWQRIDIGRPIPLLKQQQQLLQAQLKRPINIADAYVDSLLLNVYTGPGATEVWIDDLEVGPVVSNATIQPAVRPADPNGVPAKTTNIPQASRRGQVVEFNNNQLVVGGKRFLMRGINYSNTPLATLHQAGFNTLFADGQTNPTAFKEASDLGFWLAPKMRVLTDDAKLASNEGITREINRFADNDAVLLYELSGTMLFEHAVPISRAVQVVRAADPSSRPLAAEVWDGMLPFSRSINMIGVHRWPLMTTLELSKYREWLEMRRNLANPDAYLWTWIQNHMPDSYTQLLYDRPSTADFKEPVGPQPEQVQLLTYTALSAGVRGLGFWSDRWLADSHQGRDRLLMCALLNQELDMIEPLLLTTTGEPQWIGTSSPDVRAAVMQTAKGILVLPLWQGKGAQFVPGQAAISKLFMTVPQVPQSMQCWEVTPGEVRALKPERVPGGMKVTLPEFGLATSIVFTADTQQIVRFQEMAQARRQQAAYWTYDMALYELQKVVAVERQLEEQGHTQPDAAALINDAQNRLQNAKKLWENRLFSEAYREAQRGLRPVRILMRAQWEASIKNLDSPVSSPYAVSFFTLPRHWQLMDQISKSVPTTNVLPGGSFEGIPERTQEAWRLDERTLDDVELIPKRVSEVEMPVILEKKETGKQVFDGRRWVDARKETDDKNKTEAKSTLDPKKGPKTTIGAPKINKQCAMLQIKPKNAAAAPQALERTLLAITSPPVQLKPGTLVQVSGWICIPMPIGASADGALFYDSAGGEPLAIRLSEPTPWTKFTLYRRVPASGTMQVTLALTGLGTVYFDDVRIEPLAPATATTSSASVQRSTQR
jgi:hypothetical protein